MKSFFTAIVASALFAGSAIAAAAVAPLIVNTPYVLSLKDAEICLLVVLNSADLTRGHTVSISWTGGLGRCTSNSQIESMADLIFF